MSRYSAFARFYDNLTSNIDYKKHSEYYVEIIERFGGERNGILLDLACGTGSLSEKMSEAGFDVIGVDFSQEMLSIAIDKKIESGLDVQYLCQDMTRLDMFGTVDVTICALDSLNHLDGMSSVQRVFERVSLFSNPDALFIFDMNTIFKHRNVLSDNIFLYDTPEVYCVWENEYSEKDSRVDISLTFFECIDGCYKRSSERFFEKAYDADEILASLEKAGFEVLATYDYMTTCPFNDNSEKITFVARKAR